MFALVSLLAVFSSLRISTAQSCWRDTPCNAPSDPAFPGPWEQNIYSPSSRTVSPASLFPLSDIANVQSYPPTAANSLHENASAFVFDFGKEVGGIATIDYSTTGDAGKLGLAFTEAKNWIGLASDSSNGPFARGTGDQACGDGAIYEIFDSAGTHSYTMEDKRLRGGFRYLTVFLLTNGTTSLTIDSMSLEIGFAPTWSNLQAYQGYFHSNDEQLNKIWYAGAYTLQTNDVPVHTGRSWDPPVEVGWANNNTLSNGTSAIVDGAKRDRSVWPGDMGVAVPAQFVSTGDLTSVVNALQSLYDHQNSDGSLPKSGLPLLSQDSDAYHSWTLIGTYNYVLYTNDMAFLKRNWDGYQRAVDYVYGKVLQPLGVLNVSSDGDWGRLWSGGNISSTNMILYRTLTTGSQLATWMDDNELSTTYASRADTLASNIQKHLYDSSYGAFRNNDTSSTPPVYPQDANSMALFFGVVPNNSAIASTISESLTNQWTPIGAETPELPNNISPFISSFEIQGHLTIGATAQALDLIRRTWGWYLSHPNGTESSLIEGYLTNGSFGYRNYMGYEYDSSYTSHAHGWSAGPTSALTEYILGLGVTDRAGSAWRLAPQFGDLKNVEGGFTTNLGKFQASWSVNGAGDGYILEWSTPESTEGMLMLPALPAECKGTVSMDGNKKGSTEVGKGYTVSGVPGGKHSVKVSRSK